MNLLEKKEKLQSDLKQIEENFKHLQAHYNQILGGISTIELLIKEQEDNKVEAITEEKE